MPTQLSICNQALAEIASASIAAIDENSLEAKTCNQFYADTLREMLEGDHPWSFATKRLPLAEKTNDRAAEWAFAYVLPTDCAHPRRLLPDLSGATTYGWRDWADRGCNWEDGLGTYYAVEAGTVYAWFDNATLEYSTITALESKMSALFARAFSLALAVKIVWPIKKSRELKGDLIRLADIALQRAVAADSNRQPVDTSYTPESGRARGTN